MSRPVDSNFSQLSTHWSILHLAHHGTREEQHEARRQLLTHYEPAVRKFLRVCIQEADGADEMFHEFAVRVLRGDLRTTAPEKGRFRAYLKTVLYHLVADYYRAKQRGSRAVSLHLIPDPADMHPEPFPEDERAFLAVWKSTLLEKARAALANQEATGGLPLATAFRLRIENVGATDEELAGRLAAELGRTVEPGTFRRWLHTARKRFADALVHEVAGTLETPTPEVLADELQVLEFMDRCRKAYQRWLGQKRS
jgi:RNA polymerase sigma factor (sigma-70 family)